MKIFFFVRLSIAFLIFPFLGFLPLSAQSDWVKDSIELAYNFIDLQRTQIENKHDSSSYYSFKVKDLAAEMLSQKYDSVVYLYYTSGFSCIGEYYLTVGEFENALIYYDSCINLASSHFGKSHFKGLYTAYSGKALLYIQKGDYDKAMDTWQKIFNLVKFNLESEEYLQQEKLYKKSYYRNANHNLAYVYTKMGKLEKAIEYYQKSANIAFAGKYYGHALGDLDQVGYLNLLLEKYDLAEEAFQSIYDFIQDKMATAQMPNKYARLRMATVYTAMKKDSLAADWLENILPLPPISKPNTMNFTLAKCFRDLGTVYFEQQKYDLALQHFRRAWDVFHYYSKVKETIIVGKNIGDSYLAMGQADSAKIQIQQTFALIMPELDLNNPLQEPSNYRLAVGFDIPENIGQYGKAKRLKFEKTKNIFELYKSLDYYDLAARIVDAMRKDFFTEGSKQILISRAIELYEGAVETALQLYEVTKEPQHLETAFSFAEKSKSVLLLESIQGSKAHSFAGVPKNLIEQEKDLKIDLAFYSKQLYDEQNKKKIDNNKITLLENRSLQLRNEYDSLLTVFQQQYPNYFQLKYEIQYADVKEIQDYLSNDQTACIEYFWGKESLYAFLITKDKVNCIRKPLSEVMNSHLEAFTTLLSRPDLGSPETYAEHAGYLYDFLLADALKDTEVEHLIIIPDGRLGYIPFQVLIDKRKLERVDDYRKLPYVINNYEVRYEYSSTLLLAEATPQSLAGGFLGFAPKYGEGESGISVRSAVEEDLGFGTDESTMIHLAPLHFTQAEVENINNLFSGQSHTGELATEATFKKEAANHSILHLAMHAHTSDENPMYSRLIFQQGDTTSIEDGMLHAYELYNMDLQAELAVLSACETGTGQLKHGEGIMSLSRAFKYAGCPNIVMSLWQADDASTKDIMVHFYEGLKNGKGKAKALRTAKMEYLRTTGKDKSHPYYWATFVLAGDDEPVGIR